MLDRGGELVPVVLTRVDAVVTHRFRSEASARLGDVALSWPILYLSLPSSMTITCQLAVPARGPSPPDDAQWSGGRKANVLRWNLATALTL